MWSYYIIFINFSCIDTQKQNKKGVCSSTNPYLYDTHQFLNLYNIKQACFKLTIVTISGHLPQPYVTQTWAPTISLARVITSMRQRRLLLPPVLGYILTIYRLSSIFEAVIDIATSFHHLESVLDSVLCAGMKPIVIPLFTYHVYRLCDQTCLPCSEKKRKKVSPACSLLALKCCYISSIGEFLIYTL